jgi:hypothetical protein
MKYLFGGPSLSRDQCMKFFVENYMRKDIIFVALSKRGSPSQLDREKPDPVTKEIRGIKEWQIWNTQSFIDYYRHIYLHEKDSIRLLLYHEIIPHNIPIRCVLDIDLDQEKGKCALIIKTCQEFQDNICQPIIMKVHECIKLRGLINSESECVQWFSNRDKHYSSHIHFPDYHFPSVVALHEFMEYVKDKITDPEVASLIDLKIYSTGSLRMPYSSKIMVEQRYTLWQLQKENKIQTFPEPPTPDFDLIKFERSIINDRRIYNKDENITFCFISNHIKLNRNLDTDGFNKYDIIPKNVIDITKHWLEKKYQVTLPDKVKYTNMKPNVLLWRLQDLHCPGINRKHKGNGQYIRIVNMMGRVYESEFYCTDCNLVWKMDPPLKTILAQYSILEQELDTNNKRIKL